MGKLEFLKWMLSPGSDNPATCFCTVKKRAIFQYYLFPLAWLILLCRTSPGILGKSKAMHKTKALQSTFLPWSSLEKALYLNWSCTGPEHPLCSSRKPDITHRHACREDLWAALQMLPYEGRCCKLKSFGKLPLFVLGLFNFKLNNEKSIFVQWQAREM